MLELKGKYGDAKIFADNFQPEVVAQVTKFLNVPAAEGAHVRIMPDTHPGNGCVIGFTANIIDKIIPAIVGVDIGCGMLVVNLGSRRINCKRLDEVIHSYVPSGTNMHKKPAARFDEINNLKCAKYLKNLNRIENSIGTLGSGNHFIEINEAEDGTKYLVIHSGSRNLGLQVAEYYQKLAADVCRGAENYMAEKEYIQETYASGNKKSIKKEKLKELELKYNSLHAPYEKNLCFLSGSYADLYLNDMKICQKYAEINRNTMAEIILQNMFGKSLNDFEHFTTIHNYINFEDKIIRKGAVSAKKDEILIIPLNMRDGSLIVKGKGNEEWNFSAPHGAGRLYSRAEAKAKFTIKEFENTMKNIYTTSVKKSTLDESPMAYKPKEAILDVIEETAEVIEIVKPVYNFKA